MSRCTKENHDSKIIKIATWLFRLVVGAVFIMSGFVKAIDPWGSLYKFDEYLQAMGISILPTLLIIGVFGLCAFELCVGVFFILGCYRKSNPILALIFMCIMLPLTLWIAVSNPVSDCGCFGDFLILSNWATFWKNVALLALILWLIKFNTRIQSIISPAFQWMGVVVTIAFSVTIGLYGFLIQPMLDFRPYKVGERLFDNSSTNSQESEFTFVYEKDGVKHEFSENDELPDESAGWKFIERKEIFPDNYSNSNNDSDNTFHLWSRDGKDDVTSDISEEDERILILLMPNLMQVSPKTTWKINSIYDWASKQGINMIAVVSGSEESINQWSDLSMPLYPIYTADDTSIKEVARGNPALVYLDKGIIKWKQTLNSINGEQFLSRENNVNIDNLGHDGRKTLKNIVLLYLGVIGVLVAISLIPRLKAYPLKKPKQ